MSLPTIWLSTTIGDICTKVTDGSHNPPKATDSGLPMLSAKNIHHGLIDFDEEHRLIPNDEFEVENKRTQIAKDDVLLTIVGALGRTAVVQSDIPRFTLQRSVAVLRPLIDPRYFRYCLESPSFQKQILDNAKGTAQKGVYLKTLKSLEINIAPLAEQKIIADKLDILLAQVESIKARLERIPEILKQLRQSVLAAAMSGKLTEEWRASNPVSPISKYLESLHQERLRLVESKALRSKSISYEQSEPLFKDIPESWSWTSFSQIAKHSKDALKAGPFGSALKKSDCTDSGFRVYGQEQVIAGNESLVTYYISADKYKELESCAVQPGDILISLVGTIGKVLILSDDSEAGIINPRLVKLSLQDQISRDYIKYYLDSPVAHDFFKGFSHGGTMEILNLGILKGLPIPLPPVEEQRIVVSIVENLFAKSEIVEQQVQSALDRVNNLTQSILTKAFCGVLTAEWRKANPELISGKNSAEALLERIKAEHELAKPTAKRGRAKT
ncbi:specificity determinant for hsdM and hsdR [Acinetobacter baumannii]|uniref:restriction endonuclease subunit S n=1 Tax=Acinetobacter baumannii TaxID=470 RepID=UPI0002976841|nr:restriction endonuclease subunit S [Acinetobacter baumannii]EKP68472.1 type I restriction modification DNA specificity domain protein [Acinetobacter baumannii OIFC035]TPU56590.1 restriction endonuclease subunit S [Acinetobacter baumannii]SSU94653.1 specificity determinant for hsdM and hsdR [Acinetobacter baumannii]SSV56505.1 specificity determinant for hsdM and hsdR [Acinetobacter baumannii]SSV60339.1 specificity determinant for hsdM and hsdR [Acinetobacter baumannii]